MTNRTFHEIEDVTLRTWNRCALAFNLKEDKGGDAAQKYFEKFTEREQKQMYIMFTYIDRVGYEKTKREVMRNVNG